MSQSGSASCTCADSKCVEQRDDINIVLLLFNVSKLELLSRPQTVSQPVQQGLSEFRTIFG